MKSWLMFVVIVLCATAAHAQTREINPTRVIFSCADNHDQHTSHEVDILRVDGTVLQTVILGTAPPDASGDVTLTINVQPIAFGTYTVRVRAVAGGVKGADSLPSNVWDRVPGAPGKPKVQ